MTAIKLNYSYHENDSFFEIKSSKKDYFSAAPEQFPAAENSFETLQNDLLSRTDFLASLRNLRVLGRFVSFCREDPGAAGIPVVSVRIFADILADVKRKFLKKYGLSEADFSEFFNC